MIRSKCGQGIAADATEQSGVAGANSPVPKVLVCLGGGVTPEVWPIIPVVN